MNVSEAFQRRTRRHHVHSGTLFLMALRMEQMTATALCLVNLPFCEESQRSPQAARSGLGQQREGQSLFRRKRPSLSCQTRDSTAVWPCPRPREMVRKDYRKGASCQKVPHVTVAVLCARRVSSGRSGGFTGYHRFISHLASRRQ